ncbi:MAG: type II toxin-antitoxin system RelE/ParE family toxin [Comamonadaceae bacterium]|nr:type II toxin-antitoxin system RelE/ParE family toxin [Comamonadaceae bacterium]RRD56188.1 type II toxin-antitoxin system RelE/ParE family toxin [Comamonadaceae bacterium OH2545_COT-014]
MRLAWTRHAEEDRLRIWEYIAADNPPAAAQMDALFGQAAERLRAHPKLGAPGRIAGTRELVVHASYRMVYEQDAGGVLILALVHTARQWPPQAAA